MMQSRVMASPNYQNVPVPVSKRRPLPPPPRSPSPERHGTPPALPPRKSFPCGRLVKHEAIGQNNSVDEAKIDFRSLMNQWQSNSPREDAYAARLRQQAIKLTGQRRQSSTSPFVSTDCVSSHTQHSVSTPSRKWRSSGSEGFMQFSKAISCDNLTGIISVTSQSKTSSELPLVNRKIATPERMAFNERSIPLSPQITLQNMKEVTQSSTGCSSDNGDLKFDVSTFSRLSLPVGGNPSSTSFSVNNYVNPGMYVDSSLQQKRNIGNNGVHRICPPYLSQATHLLNGRDDSTYRVETGNDLGNVNNSTRQARLCDHHTSSINLSDTVGSPSDWVHDGQAQDTVQLDSALQVEQRPDLSTNDCHNNAFPASTLGCHDAQMSSLCIDNTTSYCQKVSYQTTRCRHVCGANEPLLVSSDDESTPLAQRRSVKEHIIKLEHKASITSSPTSASDCTFLSPKYNPGSSGLPIFQENHPNVNSLSCASFIATDDRKTTGRLHDSSPSLSSSVCSYSFSEHTAASHLPELGTSVDSPLISANPCFLIDTQSSLTAYHTRVQGEPPMESLHHGSGCGFMHRGVVGLDACERPRSFSSLYMHGMSSHDVYRPNESVGMEPRRRQSDGNFLCTSKSADTGMTYPLCSTPNTFSVSHRRRPSQEELECDLQARELAAELATREKKLSDVLGTSAAKKRMQYMEGLFPENYFNCDGIVYNRQLHTDGSRDQCVAFGPQVVGGVQLERSVHCSTPSSIVAEVGHVWGASLVPDSLANETLTKQKEEMVKKIHRKVEFLKFEKQCLCEDIQAIDRLGNRVSDVVHQKCRSSSGCDKFHVYIEDMEKIVRLLLNLSGQLGRAESSVQSLAGGADRKILEMAVDKRDRLRLKHDEARRLKSDVDRRCQSVSAFLCQSLSESEMGDYHRFLQMKSKLMIDGQDLDDRITLGMVQIEELKRSIQEHSVPPATSRSSSSPASSGRSSSPPL